MKCTITIDMDNAAFDDIESCGRAELVRILRDCAGDIEDATAQEEAVIFAPLFDINGNDVGRIEITGAWKGAPK